MDLQVATRFGYPLGIWSSLIASYQSSLGSVKRLMPSPHLGIIVLGWFPFILPVSGQPEVPPSSSGSLLVFQLIFILLISSYSINRVYLFWQGCNACSLYPVHCHVMRPALWHTLAVHKIEQKGQVTENLIDVLLVAWEWEIQKEEEKKKTAELS